MADPFTDVLQPQKLLPFWILPFSGSLMVIFTYLVFGFDVRFEPEETGWKAQMKKAAGRWFRRVMTGWVAWTLVTDVRMFWALVGDSRSRGDWTWVLGSALVVGVISPNYKAAIAVWSKFTYQAPTVVFKDLGIRPTYAAVFYPKLPLCPCSAAWLRRTKWLYVALLAPYACLDFAFWVVLLLLGFMGTMYAGCMLVLILPVCLFFTVVSLGIFNAFSAFGLAWSGMGAIVLLLWWATWSYLVAFSFCAALPSLIQLRRPRSLEELRALCLFLLSGLREAFRWIRRLLGQAFRCIRRLWEEERPVQEEPVQEEPVQEDPVPYLIALLRRNTDLHGSFTVAAHLDLNQAEPDPEQFGSWAAQKKSGFIERSLLSLARLILVQISVLFFARTWLAMGACGDGTWFSRDCVTATMTERSLEGYFGHLLQTLQHALRSADMFGHAVVAIWNLL